MKSKTLIQKGFTLIELLIVIAVLGVLAAIVVAAIDPVDKIASGNDAKVKSDIHTISTGAEVYAAGHDGLYPAAVATMTGSGDLKGEPYLPKAYAGNDVTPYSYIAIPLGCTDAAANCTGFTVTGIMKSKKAKVDSGANTAFQKYMSVSGKTCVVAAVGTACP